MEISVRARRITVLGLLAGWLVVSLGVGTILLGRHLLPLPRPASTDAVMAQGMSRLRAGNEDELLVVHVLSAQCRCSRRIVEHLVGTERPPQTDEIVLLLGDDAPMRESLTERGFRVRLVTEDELADLHIQSVPLLVVQGASAQPLYAGGYTARKQSLDIQDIQIIAEARRGELSSELPVYGCAASEALRRRLDPTGKL